MHSLQVGTDSDRVILLGLHDGLYRSDDAGATWRRAGLRGDDAMNVGGGRDGGPTWIAGHNVLMRSDNRGQTWTNVKPNGLPGLDLHGFAVRMGHPTELAAAVAGQGLFLSRDAGRSFGQASRSVGQSVFGMVFAQDGTLVAADPTQGLLVSRDHGATFRLAVAAQGLTSVSSSPGASARIVAGGAPGTVVSNDGGATWRQTSRLGVAAVALSPNQPLRGYAVGVDGVLYATADGGSSWAPRGR